MPINFLEIDDLLNAGKRKEYYEIEMLKDYNKEFNRIKKAREDQFNNSYPNFKYRYTQINFPYSTDNELVMKQTYIINYGDATIETAILPLPVSENTTIEFVEITSPAKIPCPCWEGARSIIAEHNSMILKDNAFYKKINSIENVMSGIISARKAEKTLKFSQKEEDKHRATQIYVSEESLKP